MSGLVRNSMLPLILMLTACGSAEFASSTANGEPYRYLCRYSSSAAYRPMQVLHFTLTNGGRTCFKAGRTILYVPTPEARCVDYPALSFSEGVPVDIDGGSSEWGECSATTGPSGLSGAPSLSYILDEEHTSDMQSEFLALYLDMQALVTNDGLPVDHVGMSGRVICMEAADPAAVAAHMRGAGVVELPFVRPEISAEACETVSRRVQNRQWPTSYVAATAGHSQ